MKILSKSSNPRSLKKAVAIVSFVALAVIPCISSAANKTIDLELRAAMVPSGYNSKGQFVGFDNNDPEVIFTVMGTLENTCHRVGPYTYEFRNEEILIHQKAIEYQGTNKVCIQTKVPFANDIRLPMIEKENLDYKIVDGKSGKTIGKLPIEKSPVVEPDSDLYLNVTDARLWFDDRAKTNPWRAVVVGMINRDCTQVKGVRVDRLDDQHALILRPILERNPKVDDKDCQPNERVQLSEPVEGDLSGFWLLHVRSVQGAGKHELVDTESYRIP